MRNQTLALCHSMRAWGVPVYGAALLLSGCSAGADVPISTSPTAPAALVAATGNTWTRVADMPTARSELGVGVVNNALYAFGGHAGFTDFNQNEVYDPVADQWTARASMLQPRFGMIAGVVNGRIYSSGGARAFFSSPAGLGTVYDPQADTWSEISGCGAASHCSRGVAGTISGKLYMANGQDGGGRTPPLSFRYDPATNRSSFMGNQPRSGHDRGAGAAIEGKLYVVGGAYDVPTMSDSLDAYDPVTEKWTSLAPMPTARMGAAAAVINGKLYVVGGADSTFQALTTLEVYSPATNSWKSLASMPTARVYAAAGVAINATGQKVLYVVGGQADALNGAALNTVEYYTP